MGNRIVNKKLLESIENQVYKDSNNNLREVQSRQKWYTKLYPLINMFIDDELQEFNSKLKKHFQNRGDIYFDEVTLKRAVYSQKTASKEMINLLGYYAFRDKWESVKNQYISKEISEKVEKVSNSSIISTQFKNTNTDESAKKTIPFFLILLIASILFASILIIYKCDSEKIITLPEITCDCNIQPVSIESEILDSFSFNKIVSLSNEEAPLEEIKHLIQYQRYNIKPKILEEESRKFINKMRSNFPEKYNDTILQLLFYQTYFCSLDKMYCKDISLSDSLRRDYMSKNYEKYNLRIQQILQPKLNINNTTSKNYFATKPTKIIRNFQIQGIDSNNLSSLKNGINIQTGLEHSAGLDANFTISFENSGGIFKNQKDNRLYYSPEGILLIKVNDKNICGELDPKKYKIQGVYKPGNTINKTEEILRQQINQTIIKNQVEIIKTISDCIK